MPVPVNVVLGVVAGLALVWLVVVALLWQARPDASTVRQALGLVPDVIRLTKRVATDRAVSRSVRLRLWLLLGYLVSPIDLVPDFIPVIGYADDAIVVALALRSVLHTAGPEAIERNWTGTPDGLAAVLRLADRRHTHR